MHPAPPDLLQQRLSVLALARTLGNVSEACRRSHMDRSSFYEWRRRYRAHGLEGLNDRHPKPCASAPAVAPAQQARICALALERAANTPARIAAVLALEGAAVGAAAVQAILDAHGLGTPAARWLHLEARWREGDVLTAEQIAFVTGCNPAFREREAASRAPAELLVQDTRFAGTARDGARLYLHAAVDTFSSYAFGLMAPSRDAAQGCRLLRAQVLPAYAAESRRVIAIETDGGPEFRGAAAAPYRALLAEAGIAHRFPPRHTAHGNGHMQRFAAAFGAGFARCPAGRLRDAAQAADALAAWLARYNATPLAGFPGNGASPERRQAAGWAAPR